MTLMLHTGAQPVDYAGLRALATPEATATHVPIPHFRVVDLIAHSLAYFGHEVVEQHFGITPDGMRFFGVLTLKSPYTSYGDVVGLRNSHDKRFPIGIGFGSQVFVCDNLALVAEHVVKRKHTMNAKRDLPGLIGEIVEPLQLTREKQHQQFLTYQGTPLSEAQADHAIMQMYRDEVINVQRIADVERQWQEPAHDWPAWRAQFQYRADGRTGAPNENAVRPAGALAKGARQDVWCLSSNGLPHHQQALMVTHLDGSTLGKAEHRPNDKLIKALSTHSRAHQPRPKGRGFFYGGIIG